MTRCSGGDEIVTIRKGWPRCDRSGPDCAGLDGADLGQAGQLQSPAADGQSAPGPVVDSAAVADRQPGRQTGPTGCPAQPGRPPGWHGGAPAARLALHTPTTCDPKNGKRVVHGCRRDQWMQGLGDAEGCMGAGKHRGSRCFRWLHRLGNPAGCGATPTRAAAGSIPRITRSELLLRPCQPPAKRAWP